MNPIGQGTPTATRSVPWNEALKHPKENLVIPGIVKGSGNYRAVPKEQRLPLPPKEEIDPAIGHKENLAIPGIVKGSGTPTATRSVPWNEALKHPKENLVIPGIVKGSGNYRAVPKEQRVPLPPKEEIDPAIGHKENLVISRIVKGSVKGSGNYRAVPKEQRVQLPPKEEIDPAIGHKENLVILGIVKGSALEHPKENLVIPGIVKGSGNYWDKAVMLCVQYECHKAGIRIPWDNAVHRLNPGSSGPSAVQTR
ncbi:hypothetical protein LZ554_002776 [Drepanopeziza brunnea f. sp. 'monogermtubi']|nr:hypothetical protein LZ554_002776 [Drepanopeziza brunnea f. sp. 'monogermtubi']